MPVDFIEDEVIANQTNPLLARMEQLPGAPNTDGTAIVAGDVTSITQYVYQLLSGVETIQVGWETGVALSPVSTFILALTGWNIDTRGYNFKHVTGPTTFPTHPMIYVVRYKFVMAADATIRSLNFRLTSKGKTP